MHRLHEQKHCTMADSDNVNKERKNNEYRNSNTAKMYRPVYDIQTPLCLVCVWMENGELLVITQRQQQQHVFRTSYY